MLKIKRPLAAIGFTFFITGSIVLSMPKEYSVILLALFALFTVFHYFTKKAYTNHLILIFITAVTAVAYISGYSYLFEHKIHNISTEQQEYNGYISAVTNNEGTGYTVMLVDDKGREKYGVSLYYGDGFELADVVKIYGKFSENKNNQYIFSNYSKNILGRITAESIVLSDVEINTVKYKALTAKREILKQAESLYSNEYLALVSAMGYSDKHLVSDKINNSFASAGIAHALVVSGFHVGVIVCFLMVIMRFVPIDKKIKNLLIAIVIIAFMYIIGLTPSIIRAGVLTAVMLVVSNFKIEQDSLTTLAVIGLFSIIQNPYITRDIGAMLSYLAATGLIITNSYCLKNKITDIKNILLCAAAAVIFSTPVLSLAGMKVTVLSPLFNLLLTIPVSIICVLSVATPVLNFIPFINVLNGVLVSANKYMIAALSVVLNIIDKHFGFALVNLSNPVFLWVIVSVIVAYVIGYLQIDNKKVRKIFIVVISILTFLCYNLLNYNMVTVTVFDSGREASFHISCKGKEYLVLSEWMTQADIKKQLVSANGTEFETVYYCPKEFKNYTDYDDVSKQVIEVSENNVYTNQAFVLKSSISKNKKLFTIAVNDCDIMFGHGKVSAEGAEYYFLGNDKPEFVMADTIYLFGNIPSWMNVENIVQVSSDLKIKINLKTGEYKTVKDVFNFGY